MPPTHPAHAQGTTNFAVLAGSAVGMSLVLFTEADLAAGRSTHEITLCPSANRTGDVWHITLPVLKQSLLYGGCCMSFSSASCACRGGCSTGWGCPLLQPHAPSCGCGGVRGWACLGHGTGKA